MKIAILQFCPDPADIVANLKQVESAAEKAAERGASLLILPELWSTGLLSVKHAVEAAGKTPRLIDSLVTACEKNAISVAGSLPEQQGQGAVWNTSFVVSQQGICARYRKINLFHPMGEHRVFQPGTEPVCFSLPGSGHLRAGLMICFDIRFPELCRELVWQGANLIVVSALWPRVRRDHFELLLRARAVENQCYVAASNACGTVNNMEFAGSSRVIGPAGDVLCSAGSSPELLVCDIDLAEVKEVRDRFVSSAPVSHYACHGKKFLSNDELSEAVQARKMAGQKMVFTNGCFDLLHAGHVDYLKQARRQGHFLVVGLNSDSSIRAIKGADRPVNSEEMRAEVLSALECVDYVVLFHESTPEKLITSLVPDVLVKGADWKEDAIVGADFVKARGGKVVRIPFSHDVSTTRTIDRIRKTGAVSQ